MFLMEVALFPFQALSVLFRGYHQRAGGDMREEYEKDIEHSTEEQVD